jgi:hypothetical protein
MDMALHFPEQRLFFSTGRRQGNGLDAIEGLGLRPAVLARYRDLSRLRYDFPLVLVAEGALAGAVRSLSSVVDDMLVENAPRGLEGERLRKHVLRLEREIRAMCAARSPHDANRLASPGSTAVQAASAREQGTPGAGESRLLSQLWTIAAAALASDDDPSANEVMTHLAAKLAVDGEVVDCDASTPARVCAHLWNSAQQRKASAFRGTVERLIVRLSDVLRAAFIHSEAGQRADALRAALGGLHREAFDFDVMSKLVARNIPKDELPASRRERIERTLAVLKAQRFVRAARLPDGSADPEAFAFRFDDCAGAADAFRARLPALVEVVKAIAIAELEAAGRYVESQHDAFFEHFDAGALSAHDLALFPDYLVCIAPGCSDAPGNAALMEVMSAGLPVKVLVETTDLIEEAAVGTGHFAFGVRSVRLANTATGLGGVFVVQSASSHLYAVRERLERAFAHRGAALVSVYAGAPSRELPPYLCAAAAMESRAFPAFTYDPYAGDTQAARFSLEDNPQAEADWPVASLEYADQDQQRVNEETGFTIADFVLCDPRYAGHFARVPRERWNASLVPADEWLAGDANRRMETVPCLLAVDPEDVLQRVIVDARLVDIVVRARTFWHRLQEQGGIHNSHAEILLAREKAKWDEQRRREDEQRKPAGTAPTASSASAAVSPVESPAGPASESAGESAPPARDTDEAWIETARCPSCNECQTINDRMFKYNENKQAYIADISAGTYRELVEAAEACQVAIIHPGKPRNPDEAGLNELLERARPFL